LTSIQPSWWPFQFLGRNSGRSDPASVCQSGCSTTTFQFLGRNSGRSDRAQERPHLIRAQSFNSSVGILVVRTRCSQRHGGGASYVSIPRSEFWSFGLVRRIPCATMGTDVSIPRSEFWSFGPRLGQSLTRGLPRVSIPRSEFWSFGPTRRSLTVNSQTDVSIPRSEFWSFGRRVVFERHT